MAVTSKVFFRGAATTASTTLYTVSSTSATAVLTSVVVTNTTGSTANFTLTVDSVSIATSVSVGVYDTTVIDLKQVIPASSPAKVIAGSASTTGVNFHLSGVEIV